MTAKPGDILIVGGGIIGLMSARELLKLGATVRIVEQNTTGKESSWAGGGILSPLYPWRAPEPINRLFAWSHREYPVWMQEIQQNTGMDPEWNRSGLMVAEATTERASVEEWANTYGFSCDWLPGHKARTMEPAVNWREWNPLRLPDIAQVRNPRLLAAIRQDVCQRGGQIIEQAAVTRIHLERQHITAVETVESTYTADTYVMATGAWSGLLESRLDIHSAGLPVEPVKGQMLVFKTAPGTLTHILLCNGKYLIPRQDGRILAGSTLEYSGFNASTTETAYQELVSFARHWLPDCPIQVENHWAGLRPGSPQGIPYICRHPKILNLYLNCGHFRNGFVMAPASARILSDLILNRPGFTNTDAYSLDMGGCC